MRAAEAITSKGHSPEMFSKTSHSHRGLFSRKFPARHTNWFWPATSWITAFMLALSLTITDATAADIRVLPGTFERWANDPVQGHPLCDIELSGQIVPGDLERLRGAFARILGTRWPEINSGEAPYRPLCLNSPGGSLGEAIRIAQFVYENSISTVLPPNSVCQSACSWIFMLGHERGPEVGGIARSMHYTARLSIHAPYIDLGNSETIHRETAELAFNQIIEGLGIILEIANQLVLSDTRPIIDSDFIETAFRHSNENWFEIDTVHKAGRWRISVFGFDPPEYLDERAAWDTCNNLSSIWLQPWSHASQQYGSSARERNNFSTSDVLIEQDFFVVRGIDDGYEGHFCVVSRRGSLCFVNYSLNLYDQVCDINNPTSSMLSFFDSNLAAFPHDTLLRDLPEISTLINARTLLAARQVVFPCWLTSSSARVTNVTDYVNLRRRADFLAPVVRQVPLGESVRLQRADNITVIGQERDRQACISACRVFGANREDRTARDRAQQCIQDNMIWYEVTDARNNRGWVSRRYLEEFE